MSQCLTIVNGTLSLSKSLPMNKIEAMESLQKMKENNVVPDIKRGKHLVFYHEKANKK